MVAEKLIYYPHNDTDIDRQMKQLYRRADITMENSIFQNRSSVPQHIFLFYSKYLYFLYVFSF